MSNEARCQNCLEYSELVEIKEEHIDHDIKGRIAQGYIVKGCSKCNVPVFSGRRYSLTYFTNEESFRKYLERNAEGLRFISSCTMRKGQKWYSWMNDEPENKTLYWSVLY